MEQIVVGVDPGIVHTGLVVLSFDDEAHSYVRHFDVIDGLDATATLTGIECVIYPRSVRTVDVFIEKYRPRSGFSTNEKMMEANGNFRRELHGRLLPNTGVNQVVGKPLLQLLDLWTFGRSTHHDDLRSAARIAVLGMLLDPLMNHLLYTFITDNLEGRHWNVAAL
jgi:hypothetical protein